MSKSGDRVVGSWRFEVGVVEYVESLSSKRQIEFLRQAERLVNSSVEVEVSGPDHAVASRISIGRISSRYRDLRHIEDAAG